MTRESQDKLFFTFCLIDMFFLPYFPLITVSYSMPVVILWWFSRRDILAYEAEYQLVQIAILLILISTIFSYILYPSYIKDNTIYLIEMSAIFLYYIMFKYYVDNYKADLEKWLFLFTLFVGALAVIYNLDKSLYQTVKYMWNARMGTAWSTSVFTGYRFGFVWMDENNIAYMITTISFFLIISKKLSLIKKIIVLGVNLLVVVSSMSSGGRNSLLIVWAVYFVYLLINIRNVRLPFKRYVNKSSLLSFLLVIIVLAAAIKYLPQYLHSTVYLESESRVEANSLDSRFNIWRYVMQNTNWWLHILTGYGGRTMVNGNPKAPHNGHFFWVMAYGMVVYGIYVYIFFRIRRNVEFKNWIALIPFLIGFTINTMVGEPKVNQIIAVLVAYMSSPIYQIKCQEYEENEIYE